MQNLTEETLLQAVLQGRLDSFRSGSVHSPLPHAEFQERDSSYLYAMGMDYFCQNGILEKELNRVPSTAEIDQAIEYFSSKQLPFMWWSSAKVLEEKGFQSGGILTGIALDISKRLPPKPAAPQNLKVKIIGSEAEVLRFTELAGSAFAMSPKSIEQWFALNAAVMDQGEQVHFMAYLDDLPVGTATLSLSSQSAGIWNLATLPEHRKAGIGASLVYAALVEAKGRQHNQIMAILLPKGMAWGLFTKLGFQEVCQFPFYIYGIAAEELEK